MDDELKNHSISLYFAECTGKLMLLGLEVNDSCPTNQFVLLGDNLETLRLANFFTRDRAERTYDTIQDALRKIPS